MKTTWPNATKADMLLKNFLMTLFIFTVCFSGSCLYARQKQPPVTTPAPKAVPTFTYKIIDGSNGTFGYDIYADNKLRIHQPSVPATPGNEGFKTKVAAEKVAQLAIAKMKKGESLPTISVEEMKKLKVL